MLLLGLPGVVVPVVARSQREARRRRDVDRGIRRLGAHGRVDGRLEAREVDHGLRPRELTDGTRGQLEVVRLHPGLGQRGDPHVLAADPLGHELQRVERGRDRHPVVADRIGRGAPAQQQGCPGGEEDSGLHDNDSHSK